MLICYFVLNISSTVVKSIQNVILHTKDLHASFQPSERRLRTVSILNRVLSAFAGQQNPHQQKQRKLWPRSNLKVK
jgi:hypothetical protein